MCIFIHSITCVCLCNDSIVIEIPQPCTGVVQGSWSDDIPPMLFHGFKRQARWWNEAARWPVPNYLKLRAPRSVPCHILYTTSFVSGAGVQWQVDLTHQNAITGKVGHSRERGRFHDKCVCSLALHYAITEGVFIVYICRGSDNVGRIELLVPSIDYHTVELGALLQEHIGPIFKSPCFALRCVHEPFFPSFWRGAPEITILFVRI